MKKILAMILCVVMVMSLASVTFAAESVITYDFANLEVGKEEIVENALDVFNAATTDTRLVSVATSKIYPGNADGGCHKGENGYLKSGTSKVPGQIVLTYGEDVKVTKVEVVCHDWYSKSEKYPTNSNSVSVNGSDAVLAPYNETGACETLSFDVAETNVVTIDLVNRVWVSKIVVHVAGGTTEQPPVEEPAKPDAGIDAENLLAAPVEITAAWNFEVCNIFTTVWGGTFDPAQIVDGGKVVVTYTGTENGLVLALNGGSWQQFNAPAANEAHGDGWAATYTYADLAGLYGNDFSTLGAIQLAANATPVTVTGVYWVAEVAEEEPPVEEPAEPNMEVAAPVVGVAFKWALEQGNLGKTLYFAGTTTDRDYYLATTENLEEAVDVYVEGEPGNYKLYFLVDGVKTYIDIYVNGSYVNARLTTEPTAVYSYNEEYKTFVAAIEKDGAVEEYYLGTYNTYSTISASKLSYVATSFPSHLYVDTNSNGGDMVGVIVALLAVSGMGITVLKKKEN